MNVSLPNPVPFSRRLGEAVSGGGFAQEDYWVWCGSVARGEDGRYHMFASRWPKVYPFFQGYTAASEIVRAVANTPTGPFRFQEVVLGRRDETFWDGKMAHNPVIFGTAEGWWLFYCGVTYGGEATPEAMHALSNHPEGGKNGRNPPWMNAMRTGVAFAERIDGPWRRPGRPLDLAPGAEGPWRAVNATPMATPDGRCRLYYRLNSGLYTAIAESPAGPYPHDTVRPISDYAEQPYTEDIFAFPVDGHYEMVSKDSTGEFTGERFALLHGVSADGVGWQPAPEPKAASRKVRWDDGQIREQGNLERPFVLFEDGRPAYLYAATSDGVHGKRKIRGHVEPAHRNAEHTWNMVIPLLPE